MSWYYNQAGGQIFEATGATKWGVDQTIFVQKNDPVPGQIIYGPFTTQAQAQTAKDAHAVPSLNPITDAQTALSSTVGSYFVRGAEIVLGVVLIAIALNAILKQTTGVDVGGAAVRAGKIAAIA